MNDQAGNSGAYKVYLRLRRNVRLNIGRLGEQRLAAGDYVYVGSARRGLRQRVDRHLRLGKEKTGHRHWHIDYLLTHGASRVLRVETFVNESECRLSRQTAATSGVTVPIPGFGATDCRAGCEAHLYRLPA